MKKITVGFTVRLKVNEDARMIDVDRLVRNIKEAARQAAAGADVEFSAPGKVG